MLVILSAIVSLAGLNNPRPPVAEPPVIGRPDWLTPPNGASLATLYPPAAQRALLNGAATIKCTVTTDGYLINCVVVAEAPAGAGFGSATVRASAQWRMSPASRDGVPVEGVVTVPMRWVIKPDPTPASAPSPAPSPPPQS